MLLTHSPAAVLNSEQTAEFRPRRGLLLEVGMRQALLLSAAAVMVLVLRMLRVVPGQKDPKAARAMQLQDVQLGDRMIIRGRVCDDGKSVVASSILVMRRDDIAEQKEHEREDWQKRGVGWRVSALDPARGTITF